MKLKSSGHNRTGEIVRRLVLPAGVPPSLGAMRPQPSDDPAIQLVEALSDLGAAVVVAPSSDDRVDCFNQLSHAQGYSPLRQASDLILELVQRLLSRNGVEIMPVQLGCDPVAAQLQSAFAASDLKSEKNSKPWAMCTIRVFSRLSVTPSFPRIFVARAKAE